MIKIKPFRALRPVRDKAHLVATRPYYCYKKSVLKAKLKSNPYSFLQIINPNYDLLSSHSEKGEFENRLNLVNEKYAEYITKNVLIRDEKPTLYVYSQSFEEQVYTGVISASSVEDYNEDRIKKHEATLTSKEQLFTSYLGVVGYNAEPVLLCHEPDKDLDKILGEICLIRPEYEFTTTDAVKHELWLMTDSQSQKIVQIFEKMDACYIADGHHRSASSALLKESRKNNEFQYQNDGYFLSFLMDENKLKIFEYNRLVKNNTQLDSYSYLHELGQHFTVLPLEKGRKPLKEHEITMLYEGKWYSLHCKPEIIETNHPVRSLDAEILTNYVLTPILGIDDLKTDPNIGFISGIEPESKLMNKMGKGKYDIAFLLFPVRMDQIKKVADNKMIMPPKSTWIEPKLRSGLTIYPINE
jgi:uncharacterized protein (DUF1015 family)